MDDSTQPMKIHGFNPIGKPCPMGELAQLFLYRAKDGKSACSKCDKPVHNLYGKTRDEVEAFVRANPGSCVQLTKPGRLKGRPA
jgi:hypothetical protein